MCLVSVGGSRGGARTSLIQQRKQRKGKKRAKNNKDSFFVKAEETKVSRGMNQKHFE